MNAHYELVREGRWQWRIDLVIRHCATETRHIAISRHRFKTAATIAAYDYVETWPKAMLSNTPVMEAAHGHW